MMNIYLLYKNYYDSYSIIGLFETRNAAIVAAYKDYDNKYLLDIDKINFINDIERKLDYSGYVIGEFTLKKEIDGFDFSIIKEDSKIKLIENILIVDFEMFLLNEKDIERFEKLVIFK